MPNPVPSLIEMYRTMLLIRRFEERVNELYMQGKIPSTLHLYIGQEAVAVGVCAAPAGATTTCSSTHRPHGHALAKGVAPRDIMAELYGQGHRLLQGQGRLDARRRHRAWACSRPSPSWAATCPSPPGMALAAKMRKARTAWPSASSATARPTRAPCTKALNMAAIWNLPVVFVCENNLYAASTPVRDRLQDRERGRPRRGLRHARRDRGRQRRAGRVRGGAARRSRAPGAAAARR